MALGELSRGTHFISLCSFSQREHKRSPNAAMHTDTGQFWCPFEPIFSLNSGSIDDPADIFHVRASPPLVTATRITELGTCC
jgi:hypothetical protein